MPNGHAVLHANAQIMRTLQQAIDSLPPAERAKVLARGREIIAMQHLRKAVDDGKPPPGKRQAKAPLRPAR